MICLPKPHIQHVNREKTDHVSTLLVYIDVAKVLEQHKQTELCVSRVLAIQGIVQVVP